MMASWGSGQDLVQGLPTTDMSFQHLLIIFLELGFDRTDCFLRYSKSL